MRMLVMLKKIYDTQENMYPGNVDLRTVNFWKEQILFKQIILKTIQIKNNLNNEDRFTTNSL